MGRVDGRLLLLLNMVLLCYYVRTLWLAFLFCVYGRPGERPTFPEAWCEKSQKKPFAKWKNSTPTNEEARSSRALKDPENVSDFSRELVRKMMLLSIGHFDGRIQTCSGHFDGHGSAFEIFLGRSVRLEKGAERNLVPKI